MFQIASDTSDALTLKMFCITKMNRADVTVHPIDKCGINNASRLTPDVIIKNKCLLLIKFYKKQILGALDLREKVKALCEMLTLLFAEVFLKGGC